MAAGTGRRRRRRCAGNRNRPGWRSPCPAIRSRRSAGANSPRRFSSNWPSRSIAARRLSSASKRSGAARSSFVARASADMGPSARTRRIMFAAGDRLLVAASFAVGVRIQEVGRGCALATALRTRGGALGRPWCLRHKTARRRFRHPCGSRGHALGPGAALLRALLLGILPRTGRAAGRLGPLAR